MQKNKKLYFAIVTIVTIIALLLITFISLFDVRVINVPDGAVFRGTYKEAFWIQKVTCNDSTMRLRIFNDYNDSLTFDAVYYTPMPCNKVIDSIRYYDKFSHKIVLFNGNELEPCHVFFEE